MRIPLLIISFFISTLLLANDTINFNEVKSAKDWENVLEMAKAQNKLLFVDAYADWCVYCHQLDEEVYTNTQVISYFNDNFINVKFDTESEYGMELAYEYKIYSLPTLLFITAKQETFDTILGFIPAPQLLAYGHRAVDDFALLPVLENKYNDLIATNEEKLDLIRILESKDFERAAEVAKDYISQLKLVDYIDNVENLWLVSRFENQLNSTPYLYITTNKDEIIEAHGLDEYHDYFKSIYNDNLQLAIKYGDENLLYQLIREVIPKFLPESGVAEAAFITKKIYFGERESFQKYEFEVNSYLNNHVAEDEKVEFLFSNGLEIIEEQEATPMLEFSVKLLSLATVLDPSHFEAAALLGYAKGLLGDYDLGIEQLKKAKTLATSDEQKEMVDGLLLAVRQMKGG
ncbi:thioredoxin family protein [Roseivirga echinicomitans]